MTIKIKKDTISLLLQKKNICMFAITRPFLLKSTEPKLFFRENLQKIIEDLYLFTKKSEIFIFCVV